MFLTARQVQEICRGIELLDAGYQKTDDTGKTVSAPYRDINLKTRLTLAKNMAALHDDYLAFQFAQRKRMKAEELDENGNIKDPQRAAEIDGELFEALKEEKEYDLKTVAQGNLPLVNMPPTLIRMLLPLIEMED
jgi:hypothetical protein